MSLELFAVTQPGLEDICAAELRQLGLGPGTIVPGGVAFTGELAERSAELAKELQITLVAAGHYLTEVFGPMRIADELRLKFPALNVQFVPVPNPL